jgi:type II secretory pathway pseudopilin PulG
MILLGILGMVALGTIVWLIGSARNEAKLLEDRQAQLETYGDQAEGVLQQAVPVAQDMNSVQAVPADSKGLDDLAADAERWITGLQQSQTQISQVFPAPEVESVNELFNEALSLYVASAQTFALVPDAEGDLQASIFARAVSQRDTAAAVWASAIGVLDTLRSDAELPASGLRAPAAQNAMPDPAASPGAEVTIPPEDSEMEGHETEDGGKKDDSNKDKSDADGE